MTFPVFVLFAFLMSVIVGEQKVFNCHGDLCNIGDEPQFCSERFKMCRDCKTVKEDCNDFTHPRNCSRYCQELAVEKEFLKERKKVEGSCFIPQFLLNIENGIALAPPYNGSRILSGSEIAYKCDDDFRLEGPETIMCHGNDTWSHTTLPYCSELSRIDFRISTIALSVICFLLVLITGICVIRQCRNCRQGNGQQISRDSTSSTLEGKELQQPLIQVHSQSMIENDETIKVDRRLPSDQCDDSSKQTPADNPEPTETSTPSAPPSEDSDDTEQSKTSKGNCPTNHERRGGPSIVINNQFSIRTVCTSNHNSNSNHSAFSGNSSANPPRKNDVKSIDEKMGKEESIDGATADKTAGENTSRRKGKGTEPLPGHASVMPSGDKGPQAVAANAESMQSPTKETKQDDVCEKIGINDVTFPQSDIKRKEQKSESKNKKDTFQMAVKESGQNDTPAKIGFDKRTFPKSDIKMKELKENDAIEQT